MSNEIIKIGEKRVKALSEAQRSYLGLTAYGLGRAEAMRLSGRTKELLKYWRRSDENFREVEEGIKKNPEVHKKEVEAHIDGVIIGGVMKLLVQVGRYGEYSEEKKKDIRWAVEVWEKMKKRGGGGSGSYDEMILKRHVEK